MDDFVVLCLGVEPKVYGPFVTNAEAEEWIMHRHTLGAYASCENSVFDVEHHVEKVRAREDGDIIPVAGS